MPLSNYTLDNFVAPKMSELTTCGAEPLPGTSSFLGSFILNNLFQVRLHNDARALLFNFIRRIQQAFYEYEQGRTNLQAYIDKARRDNVSAYFRALTHFEQCLALLYQAAMFWRVTKPDNKMYHRNDGSVLDRVNKVSGVSRHMDTEITEGRVPPDATTLVWLLNDGIACGTAMVTFAELRQELMDMRDAARQIVEELPKLAQHQTSATA